jgi:multidrug efflux system outer membrane protein
VRRRLGILLVTLFVSGCLIGPDYERPELEVDLSWREMEPPGETIANLDWWALFQDEQLQALIKTALEENKDLGIALARIMEARATLGIVRAEQYPFIDAAGRAGRAEDSRDINPIAEADDNYFLGADLVFEIDLWGKLRRATESARAELLATEATYRNVTISLVANVASFYLLLRDLDARLEISLRTLASRQDSLEIIQARFDKGTVPELDVNQAQIEVADAEASVAAFERQVRQTENALSVLLGRNPGPIARGQRLDQQLFPPEVPAGLPLELLQRRPDVVEAEQQLAAQTARIGVARALRLPALALTASYGAESNELSNLNTGDASQWSLFSNALAPIFNSGQLRQQEERERFRTEQALLNYEATLQQAFREVEDALVAVRTFRAEHEARLRQVEAARNAARLSRARYDGGIVDYLEVLDSERTLFSSEILESTTLQRQFNAIVQLYKALGGGWTTPRAPVTSP